MNHIHAENSIVIEYPYSIEKMRSDNPQTSFPLEMSADELAEWGVFAVKEQDPPAFSEQTESIELQSPALVDGVWIQGWAVVAASAEEIERRTTNRAALVRKQRNELLIATDYTQLGDYPKNADIEAYKRLRQRYRDIPQQKGFPWDVLIPTLDNS